MTDLNHLLDQIDRLDEELSKPVGHDQISLVESAETEWEFHALARTALPKLAKVIDGLIEHCHNVMSWETPRGHEERIAVESRKQGARAVYKAITDTLGADDD